MEEKRMGMMGSCDEYSEALIFSPRLQKHATTTLGAAMASLSCSTGNQLHFTEQQFQNNCLCAACLERKN